jgi:hypothetical protein
MRSLLLLLLVSLLATPALAGAPITGTYYPYDGRFTESWNGGEGQVGNTLNAASWLAPTLGGQWMLHCPSISVPPTLILDTVDEFGNGERKWYTIYGGGSLWLSGVGPWGDEDYTGTNLTTRVTSTHLFIGGNRVSAVSDVTVNGEWVGYPGCFVYTLANAAIMGVGTPTGDYPPYIDASCTVGGTGAFGDVDDITLAIYAQPDCPIAVQETTWGHVKSLYSE